MSLSINNIPNHTTNFDYGRYGIFGTNGSSGNYNGGVNKIEENGQAKKLDPTGKIECQTCKERKYQDGSNDPGVSFKTPGKISPKSAESVVRAHEQEHVRHESANAAKEGKKIISQSVSIHTGVCPECGKSFVSGGTTTTVTKKTSDTGNNDYFMSNYNNVMSKNFGSVVDIRV